LRDMAARTSLDAASASTAVSVMSSIRLTSSPWGRVATSWTAGDAVQPLDRHVERRLGGQGTGRGGHGVNSYIIAFSFSP
jgi:hypothetical protein